MEEINKKDIIEIIKELQGERLFFWSEADFQHAFAWKLHEKYSNAKIHLERRYEHKTSNTEDDIVYYVDIWGELDGKFYPIELKYKTAELIIPTNSVLSESKTIKLKEQSAQDIGRYDYLKDIQRIEHLKSWESNFFGKGFAIILTNDFHYYESPFKDTLQKETETLDRQFRIHEGVNDKSGNLQWVNKNGKVFSYQNAEESKHWTRNHPPLNLSGNYKIHWEQYSQIDAKDVKKTENIFKYCICEISKP